MPTTEAGLTLAWRLRVAATCAIVPPLLHLVPLHRVANRLSVRAGRKPAKPEALAREVDRWLTRLPPPWRTTCLKRAGSLYPLLRRAGHAVSLEIGVRRDAAGALAAHAWLTQDGHPILEPRGSDVTPFELIARFPEPVSA